MHILPVASIVVRFRAEPSLYLGSYTVTPERKYKGRARCGVELRKNPQQHRDGFEPLATTTESLGNSTLQLPGP